MINCGNIYTYLTGTVKQTFHGGWAMWSTA